MNINQIYDTIEAKVTELIGFYPNATERLEADLGLDSLDALDILISVENEHNVSIPNEVDREIPDNATLLDLAILLTNKLNNKCDTDPM